MTHVRHRRSRFGTTLLALGVAACPLSASLACTPRPVIPAAVKAPVDGLVVAAFACKDAEGEHLFVESRQQPAPVAGKVQPAELTFYKFTTSPNGPVKRWQARDFSPVDERASAPTRPQSRTARTDRFTARDVDGDGIAEAFIAYTLPGQAPNPDDGKLLVFYKDRKFAIRGAVASTPGDFGSRTLDPGFSTLPVAIQNHALTLWDTVALPKGAAGAPSSITITQAPEH